MDKNTFHTILQSALLSFDGVSKEIMTGEYELKETQVNAGIKLCEYLKSIKLTETKNDN